MGSILNDVDLNGDLSADRFRHERLGATLGRKDAKAMLALIIWAQYHKSLDASGGSIELRIANFELRIE